MNYKATGEIGVRLAGGGHAVGEDVLRSQGGAVGIGDCMKAVEYVVDCQSAGVKLLVMEGVLSWSVGLLFLGQGALDRSGREWWILADCG